MKLYVGNLSYGVNDASLRALFEASWRGGIRHRRRGPRFGPLQGLRLRRDERRGRPEGDPGAQRLPARRPHDPRERGAPEDRRAARAEGPPLTRAGAPGGAPRPAQENPDGRDPPDRGLFSPGRSDALRATTSSSPARASLDGTGAPAFRADVAVAGGRIAAVGVAARGAPRARLAAGSTRPACTSRPGSSTSSASPNTTSSSIRARRRRSRRGSRPRSRARATRSPRTTRRCSGRPSRPGRATASGPTSSTLADYFARFAKAPPTINLGTFVGLGGLRQLVVGGENRRATPAELGRMRRRSREGDGGRRPRRLDVAPVRARHLQLDRRDHRHGEGRREARRRLLHPPAFGGRTRSTRRSTRSSGSRARPGSRRTSGT